ncbi:MAG TPA: hypothetical protein VGO62_05300 [Myxococcota bacterium]
MLALALLVAMADPVPADLLQKLAAQDAFIDNIGATHTLVITSDGYEKDGDGKIAHQSHSVARQTLKGGKPATHMTVATKDGVDDLAHAQKMADERDGKPDPLPSPFAARMQPKYSFSLAEARADGTVRIAFTPKDAPSTETVAGDAIVDVASGELVKMTSHPSKNPAFVDRLVMILELDARVDGKRAMSKLTFDGAGGLLFLKRSGGAVIRFGYE